MAQYGWKQPALGLETAKASRFDSRSIEIRQKNLIEQMVEFDDPITRMACLFGGWPEALTVLPSRKHIVKSCVVINSCVAKRDLRMLETKMRDLRSTARENGSRGSALTQRL
jgi:hypothetical protein